MSLRAVAFGCVVLAAAACSKPSSSEGQTGSSANATGTEKVVAIIVDAKGFTPSSVDVKKGEATALAFTRITDATCAKEVVFPEINVTKDLPLNQPVAVVVPTDVARTLTFQCGMGMYKSSVVIH